MLHVTEANGVEVSTRVVNQNVLHFPHQRSVTVNTQHTQLNVPLLFRQQLTYKPKRTE